MHVLARKFVHKATIIAMQACMHVKCLPCLWKTRHVHACMSYSLTGNCHGNAYLSCIMQVRVTSIYGTSIEDLIPGDSGGFGHAQFLPAAPVYQLPASSQPLHSSRNLLQVGTLSEFQSDANVAAQTCLKNSFEATSMDRTGVRNGWMPLLLQLLKSCESWVQLF